MRSVNPEYGVVMWPESQELEDYPGFEDNCFLISDSRGIEKFGSGAYFVNLAWYYKVLSDQICASV